LNPLSAVMDVTGQYHHVSICSLWGIVLELQMQVA
jgi:hypothetical protein